MWYFSDGRKYTDLSLDSMKWKGSAPSVSFLPGTGSGCRTLIQESPRGKS